MAALVLLVTGSTDGIGRATAFGRASRGAEVIIHGRNRAKATAVQEEIRERTCGGSGDSSGRMTRSGS